jgi:hypothetical protein
MNHFTSPEFLKPTDVTTKRPRTDNGVAEHAQFLHDASVASQENIAKGGEPGVRFSTMSKAERWKFLSRKA